MIDLETPRRFRPLVEQAHQVAETVLRPISRKYDRGEHERPVELDMLAAVIDGMNEASASGGAGAAGVVAGDPGVDLALGQEGLGGDRRGGAAEEGQPDGHQAAGDAGAGLGADAVGQALGRVMGFDVHGGLPEKAAILDDWDKGCE